MRKQKKYTDYLNQIGSILSIITLFVVSAFYAQRKRGIVLNNKIEYATIAIFFAVMILMLVFNRDRKIQRPDSKIIILLMVIIIPRIIQIRDIAIGDASIYYGYLQTACENFDFSWESFQRFNLVAHPTMGFALICSIGKFLYPERLIGINIVKLVIVCFAGKYLYNIFQRIFVRKNDIRCMMYTIIVMNMPLFLGLFSYFTPESAVAIFMIYMIYFWIEKKYILFFFWSIILVTTKENAILVAGCFYSVLFLNLLINKVFHNEDDNNRKKWIAISLAITGSALCAAIWYILSWKWESGIKNMLSDSKTSYFGFSLEHIIIKSKQIFIINFNWLIWAIILIFAICSLIKNRKNKWKNNIKHSDIIVIIAFIVIVQIAFFLLYVTAELPRYDSVIVIGTGILMCVLFDYIICSQTVNIVCSVVISGIFLLQAFLPCDPMMKYFLYYLDTGGLPKYTSLEEQHKDHGYYNYQYVYYPHLFEKILEDADYYGQDIFLFGAAKMPYAVHDGYWDLQTNRLCEDKTDTSVRINTHDIRIIRRKDLLEVIPANRTTDGAIIIVFSDNLNDEKIVGELYKIYSIVDPVNEVDDCIYGKMYYYCVYGAKDLEE